MVHSSNNYIWTGGNSDQDISTVIDSASTGRRLPDHWNGILPPADPDAYVHVGADQNGTVMTSTTQVSYSREEFKQGEQTRLFFNTWASVKFGERMWKKVLDKLDMEDKHEAPLGIGASYIYKPGDIISYTDPLCTVENVVK